MVERAGPATHQSGGGFPARPGGPRHEMRSSTRRERHSSRVRPIVCVRGRGSPKGSSACPGFGMCLNNGRAKHGVKRAGARGHVAKAIGHHAERGPDRFFANRVSPREVHTMRHFCALACFA